MFANKLGKHVDDGALPVRLFLERLGGDALAFVKQYEFNCELVATRTTLEGTKRKSLEDHKTYGKRWRKLAVKVESPMIEEESV